PRYGYIVFPGHSQTRDLMLRLGKDIAGYGARLAFIGNGDAPRIPGAVWIPAGPPTRTCFRFWKSSQYSYLLGRSPPWKGEPWMALRKWARSSARNDPKEWRSRAGTDCSFSQKSEAHPADKKMGVLTWAGSTSSSETLYEFSSL